MFLVFCVHQSSVIVLEVLQIQDLEGGGVGELWLYSD